MIKNFLPSDTRAVELLSGAALIFSGLGILYGFLTPAEALMGTHASDFWLKIMIMFGVLQLYTVVIFDKYTGIARVVVTLFCATFWTWLGFSELTQPISSSNDTILMLLGLSNFYSFVVNSGLMRETWNLLDH